MMVYTNASFHVCRWLVRGMPPARRAAKRPTTTCTASGCWRRLARAGRAWCSGASCTAWRLPSRWAGGGVCGVGVGGCGGVKVWYGQPGRHASPVWTRLPCWHQRQRCSAPSIHPSTARPTGGSAFAFGLPHTQVLAKDPPKKLQASSASSSQNAAVAGAASASAAAGSGAHDGSLARMSGELLVEAAVQKRELLRDALELAVTSAVAHPNIVQVGGVCAGGVMHKLANAPTSRQAGRDCLMLRGPMRHHIVARSCASS